MFDPVKLAEAMRKEVCRDDLRKYYRFRPSRFYGGTATADCVGCCLINGRYLFVLETNGILIGADEGYAKDLSGFKNLYVRVSLKGTCEDEFSRLTGAFPEGFGLQLKALENLVRHGVRCHPACMISFSPPENREALKVRLKTIHPSLEDFEIEELILYPHVEEHLKRSGIPYYTAYRPDNIPPEQI